MVKVKRDISIVIKGEQRRCLTDFNIADPTNLVVGALSLKYQPIRYEWLLFNSVLRYDLEGGMLLGIVPKSLNKQVDIERYLTDLGLYVFDIERLPEEGHEIYTNPNTRLVLLNLQDTPNLKELGIKSLTLCVAGDKYRNPTYDFIEGDFKNNINDPATLLPKLPDVEEVIPITVSGEVPFGDLFPIAGLVNMRYILMGNELSHISKETYDEMTKSGGEETWQMNNM